MTRGTASSTSERYAGQLPTHSAPFEPVDCCGSDCWSAAAQFSELVVGSDQRSQTSLTVGNSQISGRANNVVSDDAGNSDLMVRRKIRVSFKDIRASFRDLVDADAKIVSQRNAPTQPLNRGLNVGVWGGSRRRTCTGCFRVTTSTWCRRSSRL